MRTRTLAAVVYLGTLCACGDNDDTTCFSESAYSDAHGVVTEVSSDHGDGTRGVTVSLPESNDVVIAAPAGAYCNGGTPCATFRPFTDDYRYLQWNLPNATGDFALTDLAAQLCGDVTCVPIEGRLTVQAISLPCADGSCGHFEAILVLADPPTPPPTESYAYGRVELYADMHLEQSSCGGGGGGCSGGFLNPNE